MRFVDFSYWAVILCFAGAIVKYVFNDIMLALQRRLEQPSIRRHASASAGYAGTSTAQSVWPDSLYAYTRS